jgi:hypothetical protein
MSSGVLALCSQQKMPTMTPINHTSSRVVGAFFQQLIVG